jgi:hypothetical protein
MGFTPQSEDQKAQAITRLVDDSLSDTERPAVEAWASQNPDVTRQVAAQRTVARGLRSAAPDVPERLIGAVHARVEASESRPSRRRAPGWLGSISPGRLALAGAAVVAVCAAAIVLALGIGGSTSPSIPGAARLAYAPATGSAPAAVNAHLLDVSYHGVQYPNYEREFAAVPTGTRSDRVGGRPALTVFYRLSDGSRLSYTVFSGKPIPLPSGTTTVLYRGVQLHVLPTTGSGLAVVTLVRFGRTCVLAAPTTGDAVVALAEAPLRTA